MTTPPKVLLITPKPGTSKPLPNPGLTDSLTHRYEVLKLLGKSSFSEVYLARDRDLGRPVVIKFLNFNDRYEYVERFRREARLLASLKHSNIVQLYDFNVEGTKLYTIMEYIEGRELDEQNRLFRERSETERIRWLCQAMRGICSALQYLHAQGIVHRDIKPSNILIDPNGAPYLIDFGIARRVTGKDLVTVNGELLGTVVYMSPEQAAGDTSQIDQRTDIYSLGVMLYHLLTDVLPFSGSNYEEILEQIRTSTPPEPSTYNAAIPPTLNRIVMRALSRDKTQRYQSAHDLMKDLEAIPRPQSESAKAGRRSRLRISLAVGLNLLAAGLIGWEFLSDAAPEEPPPPTVETKFLARETFRGGQLGSTLRTVAGEITLEPGNLRLKNGSIETANSFSTDENLRLDVDLRARTPESESIYHVTLFADGIQGYRLEWTASGEARLLAGDRPLAAFRLRPMDSKSRRLTLVKSGDALTILEDESSVLQQPGLFTRTYSGTIEIWSHRGTLDLQSVRIEVR